MNIVFENKILRKVFGTKGNEQTREWRKLHNVEFHNLYGNVDIIRILKSHRLRGRAYFRMGKGHTRFF